MVPQLPQFKRTFCGPCYKALMAISCIVLYQVKYAPGVIILMVPLYCFDISCKQQITTCCSRSCKTFLQEI